ncbi:MAG: tetratricopeptide repeat protein [Edaphocola sp.]
MNRYGEKLNNKKNGPDTLVQCVGILLLLVLPGIFFSCKATKTATEKTTAATDSPPPQATAASNTPDDLFMAAITAKMQDNREEAFIKFKLLAAREPTNATAHYELSKLWVARNNFPNALAESNMARQYDTANKWMQKQYADLLAYDGKYLQAAAIYHEIAGHERSPEEWLIHEATLLQKAKKYDEALAVLEQLAKYTGADDEDLLLQKQQLYLAKNNVDSAAIVTRQLMQYYPYESRYVLMLADIYENNAMPQKAAQVYGAMDTLYPGDPSVEFSLVRYFIKKKNHEQVRRYLRKAVMNDKATMDERMGLLLPFINYRGHAEIAPKDTIIELARELATEQPQKTAPIMLYGDILAMDNKVENALQQYKTAARLDSNNLDTWQKILYTYANMDQPDSLVQYAQQTVKIFPQEAMPWYLGGIGYIQLRQPEKSIDYLNKAISLQSGKDEETLSNMLTNLGDQYNTLRRFELSDSCYRAAIQLQPNNAMTLNNFSYYLSERGEHLDEAASMSEKSLKLRPNEATFLDTYGWILFKQGQYKEARTYVHKAIQLSGSKADATLWEHLGDIEYKLGNKNEAITNWKKASEKGNNSEVLEQKIKEQKLRE